MQLKDKIPADFYRLFSSKYRDSYISFLIALNEETARLRTALSLTEGEARAVIQESMDALGLVPSEDEDMDEDDNLVLSPGAARFLYNLIRWGWLKRDYDEVSNQYDISFPSYTAAYLEAFQKLWRQEDDLSHESIRWVYSLLHTYRTDREKDPEILEDALTASRRLLELLSNMQDGMRGYFDQLSKQKEIRGIQQVLVEEINNTDSRKYAMLTSTDSFYRYKEAVKELLQDIGEEILSRRERLEQLLEEKKENPPAAVRLKRRLSAAGRARDLADRIEREFDLIELKYNRLIEQKAVFASRASARIRYLLREGQEEDHLMALIGLVRSSPRNEELLWELGESLGFTSACRLMGDSSFYTPRQERRLFEPVQPDAPWEAPGNLESYVTAPEYTQKEIDDFVRSNTIRGRFQVTEDTVKGIEDLEKLLFVWRDGAAGERGLSIETEENVTFRKLGMKYTGFTMKKRGKEDA